MKYRVLFSEEGESDLLDLYDYIAEHDGEERAIRFIRRIEECCLSLETFPMRGRLRDDVRPGLRMLGMERRVTIAFEIESDQVTVVRILYGGRDLDRAFSDESDS